MNKVKDYRNQIDKYVHNNQPTAINHYFDTPEARKLFHPRSNKESVLKYLVWRERSLFEAVMDDYVLLNLMKDVTTIEEISISSR